MSDVQATLQAFYATTAPAFCIFTIDKKTEALKVLTELSTDLDDLTDEWDQGRILFALVRVLEPVSQLPKIVLIAWCGEGVPVSSKGRYHQHLSAMTTFFKGYHVLIQARSEEDVKLDVIMTKVKDASGAKYGIHKETGPSGMDTASTSGAGSAYTPIQTNPGRLGSMSSPSSQTALPSPTVHQEKSSARPVFSSSPSTASIPQRFSQTAAKPPVLTSQTSSPTVSKPYIQHNSFSTANSPARPEFTRNTSFDRKEPDVVASPAASKWEQERLEIERMRREQDREREAEADAEQAAWRAKSRQEEEDKAKERERQDQLQRREEERREQERRAEMERKAASESEARRRQEQEAIELAQLQISQKTTVYEAIVLYDYAKDEDNEIDLVEGEIVTQVSEEEGGWYQGTNSKGQTGYFPGNYVELRQASESHASSQVAQPAAPAVQEEAPQSQISAVALYDYDATEENEVSFVTGDTITGITYTSDDWWHGCVNGHWGLFPGNYVQQNQ